jgi:hypothetical protein
MHIGKNTEMVGIDKSNFEYGAFCEPSNLGPYKPVVMSDKK